jgi:hypothetical protein
MRTTNSGYQFARNIIEMRIENQKVFMQFSFPSSGSFSSSVTPKVFLYNWLSEGRLVFVVTASV